MFAHYQNAVLKAVGTYLPETVLSSEEIEVSLADLYQRLKLPHGRLELMSGIKERRVWPVGERPSHLSTQAALNLFNNSSIEPSSIDLLIHASVCRDFLEPATASVVHANLGLPAHCEIFDLSNACLGVISATQLACDLIERGRYRNILIVSGENSGPLLESTIKALKEDKDINRKSIKKYFANLTIGSAATAWLISHRAQNEQSPLFLSGLTQTDSSANELCQGGGSPNQLMMETDSEALLEKGVALAKSTWEKFSEHTGWKAQDIDWVIGHQVGQAHERLVLGACGLEQRPSFITYPELGNTGSAALPVTLNLLAQTGRCQENDKILLLGIGSGLSCSLMGLQWGRL